MRLLARAVAVAVMVALAFVVGSPADARCVTVGVDSMSQTICGLP